MTDPIVITVTPQQPGPINVTDVIVSQPINVNVPVVPVNVNDIVVGGVNNPVVAYHHIQSVSSAVWTVNHNLGWKPNVTVQDSAGTIVEGEITYTNSNSLTLTFTGAFSGNAYLS